MIKQGLAPVIDKDTRVLILGSLPSDISIEQQEYYANNSNDFWKLLGSIFEIDFKSLSYKEKVEQLLSRGVGLWDVYHTAKRPGSMDHEMSEEVLNDFKKIKIMAPSIKLVCFNGQKAGKSEGLLQGLGFKTVVLPSSSGANRRDQEGRLNAWRVLTSL